MGLILRREAQVLVPHGGREALQGGLHWPISPTAAPAVPTQRPQEAVDHLDGAEAHLDDTDDQQDGEESQVPGDYVSGLLAHAPYGVVAKVVAIFKGVTPGVAPQLTFWTLVDGDSRNDERISSTHESNRSENCGGEHREPLPTALIATAATAVIVLQAQEHERGEDHQDPASSYSSEIPDLISNVVVAVGHFPSREKQQDVSQQANHSQGDEGAPQALGTAARTHGAEARDCSAAADCSLPPALGFFKGFGLVRYELSPGHSVFGD